MRQNNQLTLLTFILSGEWICKELRRKALHALFPHGGPGKKHLILPQSPTPRHLSPMFNQNPSCFHLSPFPVWFLQTWIVIAGHWALSFSPQQSASLPPPAFPRGALLHSFGCFCRYPYYCPSYLFSPRAKECLGMCSKQYIMILRFYFNDLKHFNDLKYFKFLKYLHYFREGSVQKTVHTTGLAAMLRKACLYGWPLVDIWELEFPPFPDGRVVHCS